MPSPITLTSPRGATLPGTADFRDVPAASRGLKAGALLALGVAAAVPAVMVPPHGVVSAGIVLACAVGAYVIWDRARFVDDVRFRCDCGADAHVTGLGQWTHDTWARCPSCGAPWRVGDKEA